MKKKHRIDRVDENGVIHGVSEIILDCGKTNVSYWVFEHRNDMDYVVGSNCVDRLLMKKLLVTEIDKYKIGSFLESLIFMGLEV